ncbi:MAG: hypothetical protein M0R03_03820 [Novosphingobium sp.]|nr:hypothetical protein [Novosphingobium sp.]
MSDFKFLPKIIKWIEENWEGNESKILNEAILMEHNTNVSGEVNHSGRVGMSSLGAECLRPKYYDMTKEPKSSRSNFKNILTLMTGYYYHRIIQYACKQIWGNNCFIEETCLMFDENDIVAESEVDIRIRVEENGKNYVIDIKSTTNENFINVLGGRISKKYQYQANAYYNATDCDQFIFIYINKNTHDVVEIPFERDIMTEILAKNNAILLNNCFKNKTAPEIPYSTYSECISGEGKYCKYLNSCWDSSKIKEEHEKMSEKDIGKVTKKISKEYIKSSEKEKTLKEKIKKEEEKFKAKTEKWKTELKEIKSRWTKLAYANKKTIIDFGEEADKIIKMKKKIKYKIDTDKLLAEMGEEIKDYIKIEESVTPAHLKRTKSNLNLIEE